MSQTVKLGTRVVMGIPTLTSNPRRPSWIDAMAGLQMPLGSTMGRFWAQDKPIAEARNILCKAALEVNADYLFMLGDDVLPPPNTLISMLDKIGRTYTVTQHRTGCPSAGEDGVCGHLQQVKASMITGVYWTKSYPPEPYIFDGLLKGTYKDWKAGEFFPIDMAGCDCLLIDMDVLRKLPYPWFSTDWSWEEGQGSSPIATEDYYFYTVARREGFRLFADTSLQCLHEDRTSGAAYGLQMDMYQAGGVPQVGEDEVLVADIGAGLYTPTYLFGPNAKIVRFDIRESVRPDVRCDIRAIDSHQFGKYDIVVVHHVLEHFRRIEAPDLLAHWCKLLKVGGQLIIGVPNLEFSMNFILNPPETATAGQKQYAWAQLYGDQADEGSPWEHKNGFTARKLSGLLQSISGLGQVEVTVTDDGQNLKGSAVVLEENKPFALAKVWGSIVN